MSSSPLLSICIPTYNREKYLQEALDNIITQKGFNEEEIEIVISDNASSDNTKKLVESYQSRYSNIRYSRNDTNLGADRNVLKALSLGKGEYVWGATDDDIIFPGGIERVKEVLYAYRDQGIGFLQTNFSSLNKDGNLLQESFLGKELPTRVYDNIHELYQSYHYCHNGLTFFSINIFHSSVLDFDINAIPITNFPHSCIMGLIFNKKVMFIAEPLIGYRTNNNADNFGSIRYFFYVFVICHMKYMWFLWRHHSIVSQWQLSIILVKMVIYSTFLFFKKYTYKVLHFFR